VVSRHTVRAERSTRSWVIWIDGEPRTQAKREREIETMARDWLSLTYDREPESFDIELC